MQNLYQYEDFFRLLIVGVRTVIEEPIGWDKVVVKVPSDDVFFGFNYEFVDDKTNLTFADRLAYNTIEGVVDTKGADGDIQLEYGYREPYTNIEHIMYVGAMNLNDMTKTDGISYTIPTQKLYFEDKLRTRSETMISLNALQTLDLTTKTATPQLLMNMHSKRIVRQAGNVLTEQIYDVVEYFDDAQNQIYVQPDTQSNPTGELTTLNNSPMGVTATRPDILDLWQFKATEAGTLTITFLSQYTIRAVGMVIGTPSHVEQIDKLEIEPYIRVKRAGSLVVNITDPKKTYDGFLPGDELVLTVSNEEASHVIDLQVDDEVYVGWQMRIYSDFWGAMVWVNIQIQGATSTVSLTQSTVAPATNVIGYNYFQALTHVVWAITGVQDAVESVFFGPGGCGEKWGITNGYMIRNFQVADHPVQTSWKQLTEAANSAWCMGVGYKTLPSGKQVVVIEPFAKFYSGAGTVLTLTDIGNLQETFAKNFMCNEFQIGFEKYGEDDENTLDDYSTYQTRLLPVTTYKTSKKIECSLVASGYVIEDQRREQFKDAPSTSLGEDDSIFLVNYNTISRDYRSIGFSIIRPLSASSIISFDRATGLNVGDKFYITGGTTGINNGILFTVTLKGSSTQELYVTFPTMHVDNGYALLQIMLTPPPDLASGVTYVQACRDEAFDIVTGVLSPESVYNLRLTPQRMLWQWRQWLLVGLHLKPDNALLQCTYVQQNGKLTTQIQGEFNCNQWYFSMREDEPLEVVWLGAASERPFTPRIVTFETRLSYSDLTLLKQAARGELPDGDPRNYGVIVYPDASGAPWVARTKNIEYEPASEKVTIEAYKVGPL